MPKHSDTAPATKADIHAMMESIGRSQDQMISSQTLWKQEVIDALGNSEARTKEHFDAVAENLRHDFLGATRDGYSLLRDSVTDHGQRISTLERTMGVAS